MKYEELTEIIKNPSEEGGGKLIKEGNEENKLNNPELMEKLQEEIK